MSTLSGSERSPRVCLNRRYRFSASHRLHVTQMSEERNRELFGKCNNPHGHGHNYTLQVTVEGPVAADTGMVVNLGALDAFVQDEVLERFEFANLNADAAFALAPPSTENLAVALWDLLAGFVQGRGCLRLQRVRVEETQNNAFDYFGEGASALPGESGAERRKANDHA